jgi:hypothetical protein
VTQHQEQLLPIYQFIRERGIRCAQIIGELGSGLYHHAEVPMIEHYASESGWFAYYGHQLPMQTYETYAPFTRHMKWQFFDRRQPCFWEADESHEVEPMFFEAADSGIRLPVSWSKPKAGNIRHCQRIDSFHEWMSSDGAVGASWFIHPDFSHMLERCLQFDDGVVFVKDPMSMVPSEWLERHFWIFSTMHPLAIPIPHINIRFLSPESQFSNLENLADLSQVVANIEPDLGLLRRLSIDEWPRITCFRTPEYQA